MYDLIKSVEKKLASSRSKLAELDEQLADENIYADTRRKDELTQLVKDQAAVKTEIESLEWEWLDASEKLEQQS